MKKYDIIGIGNPGQDMVVELEKIPYEEVSSKMYDCSFQGGGWVATALCAAGNLGANVSMLGVIGDDIFGKMIVEDLKYNNVDTEHLIVADEKRSNFCICITERATKSKHIISRGGELREVETDDIDEDYIKSAKMIHVGFVNDAVRKAADIIHKNDGKVSVDAAYYKPYVYENYDIFDIFIGSEYYFNGVCEELGLKLAELMTDDEKYRVMKYIQSKGPEIVIFTFGEYGSMGIYGDKTFKQPAMKAEIKDTTGAGDVFHGAFDVAYINGFSVPEAARFATGVSTIKCTQMGGRAGISDKETLEVFLETGKIDKEKINKRVEKYLHGLI
ncbi:MAG: carbohydrate kinase family protein [Clostridiales bacterium]|nr:carbohydrate kinase family protein [Clostridiales bacterium]